MQPLLTIISHPFSWILPEENQKSHNEVRILSQDVRIVGLELITF